MRFFNDKIKAFMTRFLPVTKNAPKLRGIIVMTIRRLRPTRGKRNRMEHHLVSENFSERPKS